MRKLSALMHAHNEGKRLGRTLETLRPCDEVVVVDHGSSDDTVRVARQYGAKVVKAVPGVDKGAYAIDCRHDWVLCLEANESLTESLEASLFEWKQKNESDTAQPAFNIGLRVDTGSGWEERSPQTRLVNRNQINWQGALPPNMETAPVLEGKLLRFEDGNR